MILIRTISHLSLFPSPRQTKTLRYQYRYFKTDRQIKIMSKAQCAKQKWPVISTVFVIIWRLTLLFACVYGFLLFQINQSNKGKHGKTHEKQRNNGNENVWRILSHINYSFDDSFDNFNQKSREIKPAITVV